MSRALAILWSVLIRGSGVEPVSIFAIIYKVTPAILDSLFCEMPSLSR